MSEWQPIDTAPADGTRVLVLEDSEVFLSWQHRPGRWHTPDESGRWELTPTYWMPLPKIPDVLP